MSTDTRKACSEAKLRDAMTRLLEEKPFDQITTKELVKEAGVSRSGFYTHYQDKYGMIEHYQQILFNTIQYVFEKNKGDLHTTLIETFEFLDANPIYAALLSENGSKEIQNFMRQKLVNLIDETIYPKVNKKHLSKVGRTYSSIYYAYAIFGLTQTWLRRKHREKPAMIADLLINDLIGEL